MQEAGMAAGIVMMVVSFIWLAGLPGLPGAYPVVPCLGAVLVIRCGRHSQLAQATLASLPLRTIGRISYSLYLWHWPVLVFHRQRFDSLPTWLLLPVIGLLGAASYRWIETPFRKPGSPWRRALALGGLTTAAASLAIITVPVNSMLGGEFADLQSPEAQTNGMAWDATKPIRETGEPLRIGENRSQVIAVYGSSHARMMSPPLVEAVQAGAPFSLILLGSSGNGVTVETEPTFNARRLAILEKEHPSVVLVFDKWNWLAEQPDFESALARELGALAACAPRVLVHSQPPMPILPAEHEKQLYRYLVATHQPDPRLKPNPVVPAANDRVRRVVESLGLPGVRFVDTYATLIRDDGSVRVKQAGQFLYFDWNHLNHRGARVVYARHVRPLLETAKP
jgi:SGNH domain (fused to AT3 domains)/Acyltransferase family